MDSADQTTTLAAAWEKYEAAVTQARIATEATERYKNRPEHRAQAYHALIEAQASAYNFAIAPRMDHPHVATHSWYSYFYTLGGPSADHYNATMLLDGRRTYRVTGRFGGVKLILFQVSSHVLGHPECKLLKDADISKFELNPDGSFELIMSAQPHEGNWLPLDPNSNFNFVFIRRFVEDWYVDRGALDVSLVDGPAVVDYGDESIQAERLELAAYFLTYLVEKWNIGVYDLYRTKNHGAKNTLAVVPGASIAADFAGSSSTNYTWGIYDIKDDEALIIESEIPDANYWSYQVMGVWCKPINFVDTQNDLNMHRIVIDSDGRFRAVIAMEDPGVANWLDPSGQHEGTITGRAYQANSIPPAPVVRLVKLNELRNHLPPDTKYVSPVQRQAALDYRSKGYRLLFNGR